MRDRNKNKSLSFTDFVHYLGDNMSGMERNSFERELQRDPFAEEASEGFASVTPGEALKDISALKKELKKRTARRQNIIFVRIAAAVAVLMIVSSVLIIIEKKSSPKQLAANTDKSEYLEITPSAPVTSQESKKELAEQTVSIPVQKAARSAVPPVNTEPVAPAAEKRIAGIEQNSQKEAMLAVKQDENVRQEADTVVLQESDAIEVTGMGISRERSEMKARKESYAPPSPVCGKSEFDKYVRKEMRLKDSIASDQKVVVVLSFSVQTDGIIDSIKITESPGKLFSDEAIRLLRSGPAWKPAVENGKVIKEKVSLRIVLN